MKARLVTRKTNAKINKKDQALNTVEPKRKSTSIAHVYELSASGAPGDIVKNAADSPRKS